MKGKCKVNKQYDSPEGKSTEFATMPANIVEAFSGKMVEKGFIVPTPIADGKIHRFQIGDKKNLNGWYCLYGDGLPAGSFGDWVTGGKFKWCGKHEAGLSDQERTEYLGRLQSIKIERERIQAEDHKAAAIQAKATWESSKPVTDHPYLTKKQVQPYGIRQDDAKRLVVPVHGADSNVQSLQFISGNGFKQFLEGGKMAGGYFYISGTPDTIAIAEGYSTGASIFMVTGYTTYIAFNAGNLLSVAKIVKARHPGALIVVCCDNDKWLPPEKGNPGLTKGRATADAVGAIATAPVFKNESTKPTDFNDLAKLEGFEEVKRQIVAGAMADNLWESPIPLNCELLPVMAFNPELLPEPLRVWVKDIAHRMQSPIDYPAIGAMVAYSAIAGKRLAIHPKRFDDWVIVPNLWGGVIGRPSAKKTPALQEVLKPLFRLEYDAKNEYEAENRAWMTRSAISEMKADTAKQKAKILIKAGKVDEATSLLQSQEDDQSIAPIRKRIVVNDATIEKLGEILAENPNGVILYRDELFGFLKTINREDHANDRAFHLECWAGLGRYTYDRIGRGTIDIENCIESILGCLTPSKLTPLVNMAMIGGVDDDGFIQRFQLMVYPDDVQFKYVDKIPDKDARDTAYEFFKYVSGLSFEPGEYEKIPSVHFSEEAQKVFSEWLSALEMEIARDDIHPAIESHLAKYRSLIPSLALLIHLGSEDDPSGDVQLESLHKAIAWGEYLKSHALRVYGLAINNAAHLGKLLLDKIRVGKLTDPFVISDAKRPQWHGLTAEGSVESALKVLVDAGYLRIKTSPTGGKAKTEYFVNPKIFSENA